MRFQRGWGHNVLRVGGLKEVRVCGGVIGVGEAKLAPAAVYIMYIRGDSAKTL